VNLSSVTPLRWVSKSTSRLASKQGSKSMKFGWYLSSSLSMPGLVSQVIRFSDFMR